LCIWRCGNSLMKVVLSVLFKSSIEGNSDFNSSIILLV
jgi:hypothetical protein